MSKPIEERIKGWIARDKNNIGPLCWFFIHKPIHTLGGWTPILKAHRNDKRPLYKKHGLKPGGICEAELIVRRVKK